MSNATKVTVSTFGTLAGLAGLEHGIGEVLQGNIAPEDVVISSWPGSAFFRILAGEPAMTIVPNLLASGILTILVSLVFITWAIRFAQRKKGGAVLILLSIALLLVGGGFGPPLLGIIVGAAASRMNAPSSGRRAHPSMGLRASLGKWWLWTFSACILAWLCLFPGSAILGYFFGVEDPSPVPLFSLFAFGTLLLTIFSGFAHDMQRQTG